MALTYIDWERNGILVLSLIGDLRLGSGTSLLRQLIDDAISQDRKDIIIHLGDVVYIDSTGLGELVSSHLRVSKIGGRISWPSCNLARSNWCNPPGSTWCSRFIRTKDSAVASFSQA